MFSRPVSSGWKPVPTSSSAATRPRVRETPAVGAVIPARILRMVLLPAPLRPTMPSASPSRDGELTSSQRPQLARRDGVRRPANGPAVGRGASRARVAARRGRTACSTCRTRRLPGPRQITSANDALARDGSRRARPRRSSAATAADTRRRAASPATACRAATTGEPRGPRSWGSARRQLRHARSTRSRVGHRTGEEPDLHDGPERVLDVPVSHVQGATATSAMPKRPAAAAAERDGVARPATVGTTP